MQTPERKPLVVPTQALAVPSPPNGMRCRSDIRPLEMPHTRAANVAIDRVAPQASTVADAIAAYGNADLICYRADAPEPLVRRQAEAWDPLIGWAAQALSADLRPVIGVMHRDQPPDALTAMRRAVDMFDPFRLTGTSPTRRPFGLAGAWARGGSRTSRGNRRMDPVPG
jgi:chaperone required for assembly of F1-ATPase